jgi:hypothetical protein
MFTRAMKHVPRVLAPIACSISSQWLMLQRKELQE